MKLSFDEYVKKVDEYCKVINRIDDLHNSCVGVNCSDCPYVQLNSQGRIQRCLASDKKHIAYGRKYDYAQSQCVSKKLEII